MIMIELYECSEEGCAILVDVSYRRELEKVQGVYCRWHRRRQKQANIKVEKQKSEREHVTSRVGECFYCGDEEPLTRDHVIPKSKGKQFKRPWNTVWCCEFCNRKKADSDLADWIRQIKGYIVSHGSKGVSPKYLQVLDNARYFVSALLEDPSRRELTSYRVKIDPWWGDDPKMTV